MRRVRMPFPQLLGLGVAVVLVSGPIAAVAQTRGSFDRTLNVTGTPDITVQTGAGNITVTPGTDAVVHIAATIEGSRRSGGDVAERVRRIEQNPPIEQRGNVIVIGRFQDRDLTRNISISYDLTLPANSRVKSTAGSGNVRIERVGGSVTATTGSGNVALVRTGGDIQISTGSGHIEIDSTSGSLRATTGSGLIRVVGVSGKLSVSTGSGNVEAAGTQRGEWELSTGSGNIHVELPESGAFTVDAHTGSGSIDTTHSITVSGRFERRTLRGDVRGGGPLLKLRSGSGSITIR